MFFYYKMNLRLFYFHVTIWGIPPRVSVNKFAVIINMTYCELWILSQKYMMLNKPIVKDL